MAENVSSVTVDGRYYWQLIFSYDNTSNHGDIKQSYHYTKKKSVSSRDFMSSKFNVNTSFTYDNKNSASVKFEGIGEGSSSVEFNFHVDTAYELQKTSETNQSIEESTDQTRDYTIAGGGKLDLYQLCYTTDGVDVQTDTFATNPKPDTVVKLRFSCHNRILGLEDILDKFSHTFPGSSNRDEWARIRNTIVQNSDQPALTQFRRFVEVLGTTTPASDNKDEWASIRATCNEIKTDWDGTDRQLLFKKLLERFSITRPGRDNKDEWSSIRDLSDKILSGLKELAAA